MTGKPDKGADEPTPDELRERIEGTREELGRTVEELAAKADVKAQARQKAAAVRGKAAGAARQAQGKGADLLRSARDNTPEPVREQAAQAATAARRNQGVVFAGGAALVLAYFLARRTGSGRSKRAHAGPGRCARG
ncbi:hypothetical protein SSPS47_03835 [Streptomyces sp. S4.7]|uniref:DUF3618 domain-containing protein n=1 Tax=Streptomyces sp. S4.7 TaxID=2705439 RepID=UPI0013982FEE|nr:DUF3618 domain-containing protein [Streptomyces sp. S4.7]QHY94256.1 hypothetical protein SSPS47_03835 [Streptomyces sp. S4.7]